MRFLINRARQNLRAFRRCGLETEEFPSECHWPGTAGKNLLRAVCVELTAAGIEFEREKRYPVQYRGVLLCEQHLDFVVEGQIVLEIKSIDQFAPVHHTQILSYMRVARLRAGLLMNFNVVILPDGMCRKVL